MNDDRFITFVANAADAFYDEPDADDMPIHARQLVTRAKSLKVANATIGALRAELAALKAATAWRPVTENRPSPGYYLTYHPKVGADVQYWTGYDSWVNGAYGRQPTYWRPLPPAPDEADEV